MSFPHLRSTLPTYAVIAAALAFLMLISLTAGYPRPQNRQTSQTSRQKSAKPVPAVQKSISSRPNAETAELVSRSVTGDPNRLISAAVDSFHRSSLQEVAILSQSAADPNYASPERLLKYPGSPWEFQFVLNRSTGQFNYREVMDTDTLSLLKKGGRLLKSITPTGAGNWQPVKTALLSKAPYCYARTTALEHLPFLFLDPLPTLSAPPEIEKIGGQQCFRCRLMSRARKYTVPTEDGTISPDVPAEFILWITASSPPRLARARYFWISNPPGGPLYTANLVTFKQE